MDEHMVTPDLFNPNDVYQKRSNGTGPLQLFVSPCQYIQGRGVLQHIGEYIGMNISDGVGLLITPGR